MCLSLSLIENTASVKYPFVIVTSHTYTQLNDKVETFQENPIRKIFIFVFGTTKIKTHTKCVVININSIFNYYSFLVCQSKQATRQLIMCVYFIITLYLFHFFFIEHQKQYPGSLRAAESALCVSVVV